jgi:hypothetical protein
MVTTSKWLAVVAVAFVAGSFIASPELRAFAANTVFSGDIVDGEVKTADLGSNSVTAAKIKDGEVKAAEIASNAVGSSEIATDAVGAAELQGVTKLLFGQCVVDSSEGSSNIMPGNGILIMCSINGVDSDDTAVAMINGAGSCFEARQASTSSNQVAVVAVNECTTTQQIGTGKIVGIMVFDK